MHIAFERGAECNAQVPADVRTFNAMIRGCRARSEWELAVRLLEQMQAMHIQPNTITYSTIFR